MTVTKEQFEEYKEHRKQKNRSGESMFDDLEELEEMWIREIAREEVDRKLVEYGLVNE